MRYVPLQRKKKASVGVDLYERVVVVVCPSLRFIYSGLPSQTNILLSGSLWGGGGGGGGQGSLPKEKPPSPRSI